jgi:tellurite methyltransferase
MTDPNRPNPPSPFVERWIITLGSEFPQGRALDVACGRGRHALPLAAAGFHVVGLDIQMDALADAHLAAQSRGLAVSLACADLTSMRLPRAHFHVIVVTRYLDRQLFPALRDALVTGGVLLYETFTEQQLQYDRGPRSRDHLLAPGELRMLLQGMDVLFDEEVSAPDAVARVAARRRRRTISGSQSS